jgi:hypothetical protein
MIDRSEFPDRQPKMRLLMQFQLLVLSCLFILAAGCLLPICILPAKAQFRSYARQQLPKGATTGKTVKYGGAYVYPEFRHSQGVVRWIKDQMPLRIWVSPGLSIDGFTNSAGEPTINTNNLPAWTHFVAKLMEHPEQLKQLSKADGFQLDHYKAAVDGINMWKPFANEGLFSYQLTDNPDDAFIHVFFTHHFVNKLGLGLFANDIRGYTSKDIFPLKPILAGAKANFTPVVVLLRTTDPKNTNQPRSYTNMRAAAAHEFGHVLGIDGHSKNPNDLMSDYYGKGVISPNDAATIRYLYQQTPDLIP